MSGTAPDPGTTARAGDADPEMSADATDATDRGGQDAADAPATTPAPGASPTAPQADDAAWKQVQTASFSRDEAGAILKFDDYARTNPDRHATELQSYTDKALDRIWFERIEQLCKQRDEWKKKIAEADKDLSEETNDAYKKRVLVPLKEQYAKKLQSVDEELTQNMKFTSPTTPNLLDDAELERLRKDRDPAQYTSWKTKILTHIRRTHGELPWAADKSS
jgi:hypothetical protein